MGGVLLLYATVHRGLGLDEDVGAVGAAGTYLGERMLRMPSTSCLHTHTQTSTILSIQNQSTQIMCACVCVCECAAVCEQDGAVCVYEVLTGESTRTERRTGVCVYICCVVAKVSASYIHFRLHTRTREPRAALRELYQITY